MRTASTFVLIAPIAAGAWLAGCNPSPGLHVVGAVRVNAGGTPSGFEFAQLTRIDGTGPAGSPVGACTISGDRVAVDIDGPSDAMGFALRNITIQGTRGNASAGRVDVELGSGTYTGACAVEVPYAANGTTRLTTTNCMVTGGGQTASVNLDLSFERCVTR